MLNGNAIKSLDYAAMLLILLSYLAQIYRILTSGQGGWFVISNWLGLANTNLLLLLDMLVEINIVVVSSILPWNLSPLNCDDPYIVLKKQGGSCYFAPSFLSHSN